MYISFSVVVVFLASTFVFRPCDAVHDATLQDRVLLMPQKNIHALATIEEDALEFFITSSSFPVAIRGGIQYAQIFPDMSTRREGTCVKGPTVRIVEYTTRIIRSAESSKAYSITHTYTHTPMHTFSNAFHGAQNHASKHTLLHIWFCTTSAAGTATATTTRHRTFCNANGWRHTRAHSRDVVVVVYTNILHTRRWHSRDQLACAWHLLYYNSRAFERGKFASQTLCGHGARALKGWLCRCASRPHHTHARQVTKQFAYCFKYIYIYRYIGTHADVCVRCTRAHAGRMRKYVHDYDENAK